MRLATFRNGCGEVRIGAMSADDTRMVDLAAAAEGRDAGAFRSMQALIEGGERALDLARSVVMRAQRAGDHLDATVDVRLLAPIPVPAQIRDFSVFPTHIVQSRRGMERMALDLIGRDISTPGAPAHPNEVRKTQPAYYFSNRFNVSGPGEAVTWPRYSRFMDFELEVAAVIGRRGKDISVGEASSYIFGYTIYNDFSARDAQLVEMGAMLGPAKGKSFDLGNAMGPVIVTPDEIADVRELQATARVNGNIWMSDTLREMQFSFEEMLAYVSRDETLHAGEIFGSGTVGNGCGLESSRFLEDGDEVSLEVSRIGVLTNRVVRRPVNAA
jgi:2-keto-4-pentenoate hydratase/2-oxohepta-3-ene-1,7-dioic acid hydratase in catechol pathway